MSWSERNPPKGDAADKRSVERGVFRKCEGCGEIAYGSDLAARFEVCGKCGHHHRLGEAEFRALLLDGGALDEWAEGLSAADPLSFSDGRAYTDRLAAAKRVTGASDAVRIGRGAIEGAPVAYGAFSFGFMGGSMGSVVGEKVARLFERAVVDRLPVVLLSASGGARMQEGVLSLMQMAKSVAAREALRDAGLPFISLLTHPTTGGVAASFAFLGDVNVAEPSALIGFAGPRVIETTIRQKLPEGFQRPEFLSAHGMVDMICPRDAMKTTLATILRHLTRPA